LADDAQTMSRARRLVVVFVLLAGAGCGGDAGPDCSKQMTLPVEPSLTIVSLSQSQRRELCDYAACMFGGYGARLSCSTGAAVTISGNQSACLATTPTDPACTATVQEFVGCMDAIRAKPCTSTFLGDPACAAVTTFACLTITPAAMLMATASAPSP